MSTKSKAAKAKTGFGAKGWGILALTFFSILLMSNIIYDSLNVTIPAYGGMGWNVGILYMFSTVAAWISVIGAGLWGALCGKKTCRLAWTISLLVAAVGCVIWNFAPGANSVPVYFIGLAIANIGGMGFGYIASLEVISNWFPRKKGLAMGWVTIGFPLSAVIASPLCGALVGILGLNGIYLMYAVLCVILAVLVWVFVRDYPEEKGAYPDNNPAFDKAGAEAEHQAALEYMKTSPWTGKKLLRTPNFWKITVSLGVMELLSLGIMTNFMPRMMQIGYEQMEIIPMLMVTGLVACVGSVLCGVLDSKVGPKKAIIITYIIAIVAIALNVVAGIIKEGGNKGLATPLFYISLPFLAIMLGGAANYLVSLTNTIWGRYDFPAAYRYLKPFVAIVGAIGITIVGGLGNSAPGYGAAYLVLGILSVIALIVILTVDDSLVGKDI